MSDRKELIYRVEAKKKFFQAELVSMKDDLTDSAIKNKAKLEKKIKDISADIKKAEENFSEAVAKKINEWLK